MLIDIDVDVFMEKPWGKKASVLLLVAEKVFNNLKSHVDAYNVCEKAVNDCWVWLGDREMVSPQSISYYVDSDEVQQGCLDESNFESGGVEQSSLIFILMVVGYFANRAYLVSGISDQMSESVCEANDNLLPCFLEFADQLGHKDFIFYYLGR